MIIKTTNLSKSFRTSEVETIAVNNLNFEVEKGEFVAIMGPSGCGKTTLLNLLGLLDTPTGGVYELNGRDVSKLNERDRTYLRRGKVGFIFQSFNLIDELTVFENIELPLTYLKIKSGERRRIVTDLMRRMEISHRASHFPHQLSGGQQQRVAIARAVVSSPELILADEPTGNLDSKNGVEVMNILSELNAGGTTVVMVTHNRRDAEYAHRIVEMFDGEILGSEQTANSVAERDRAVGCPGGVYGDNAAGVLRPHLQ